MLNPIKTFKVLDLFRKYQTRETAPTHFLKLFFKLSFIRIRKYLISRNIKMRNNEMNIQIWQTI